MDLKALSNMVLRKPSEPAAPATPLNPSLEMWPSDIIQLDKSNNRCRVISVEYGGARGHNTVNLIRCDKNGKSLEGAETFTMTPDEHQERFKVIWKKPRHKNEVPSYFTK